MAMEQPSLPARTLAGADLADVPMAPRSIRQEISESACRLHPLYRAGTRPPRSSCDGEVTSRPGPDAGRTRACGIGCLSAGDIQTSAAHAGGLPVGIRGKV